MNHIDVYTLYYYWYSDITKLNNVVFLIESWPLDDTRSNIINNMFNISILWIESISIGNPDDVYIIYVWWQRKITQYRCEDDIGYSRIYYGDPINEGTLFFLQKDLCISIIPRQWYLSADWNVYILHGWRTSF